MFSSNLSGHSTENSSDILRIITQGLQMFNILKSLHSRDGHNRREEKQQIHT